MDRPEPLTARGVEMGPAKAAGLLLGQAIEGIVAVGGAIPVGQVAGGVVGRCGQAVRRRGDRDHAVLGGPARGGGGDGSQVAEGVVGVVLRVARGRAGDQAADLIVEEGLAADLVNIAGAVVGEGTPVPQAFCAAEEASGVILPTRQPTGRSIATGKATRRAAREQQDA